MFREILDSFAPQFTEEEWQRLHQEYDKAVNLAQRKQKLDLPFLDRMRRKADYSFKLDSRKEAIGLVLFFSFWIGGSMYFHSDNWRIGLALVIFALATPIGWIGLRYILGRPSTPEKVNEHFGVRDFVDETVQLYIKNLELIAKLRRGNRSKTSNAKRQS
jgi:hypothetical protein